LICPVCRSENIEGADQCANCGQSLYGLDLPGGPKSRPAPDFIDRPISVLPKREVVKVSPHDPVGLAVRHMQRHNINYILVLDGDKLKGIITGWDILQKVAGPRKDLNAVTCAQMMTPDPLTLHEEDSLALALNVMASGGFRHIPVVKDGGDAIGVIDVNDLFRFISPHLV
jgi:CBS domain-containing protein